MTNRLQTMAAATLMIAAATTASAQTAIHVGKTRGCGCCIAWMERLAEAGLTPKGENLGAP